MSIAFGILLLVGAAFWLFVTLRVLPGSTHMNQGYIRPGATYSNTWTHFLLGAGLTVGCLIGGLVLVI